MEEPEADNDLLDKDTEQHPEFNAEEDIDYKDYYARLNLNLPQSRSLGLKIANFLEKLIELNSECKSEETLFDMKQLPKITLDKFLQRIIDYSHNSPESWILALILIERYTSSKGGVFIHRLNIYK